MIVITDTRQLTGLPPPLERLVGPMLRLRAEQLANTAEPRLCRFARFLVVEPGDSVSSIDTELGFSLLQNLADASRFGDPDFDPSWEWIEDHGTFFELVFVLTDDGFAHVIIVLDRDGVDPALLDLCRRYGRATS